MGQQGMGEIGKGEKFNENVCYLVSMVDVSVDTCQTCLHEAVC